MLESEWNHCGDPVALLNYLDKRITERQFRLIACACARRLESLFESGASSLAIGAAEKYADGLITADELRQAEEDARKALTMATREAHSIWAQGPAAVTARRAWVKVWARTAAANTCERDIHAISAPSLETDSQGNPAVRTAQVASWALEVLQEPEKANENDSADTETPLFFAFLRGLKTTVRRIAEDAQNGLEASESVVQARIVRDILGNPFRPVAFAHQWRFDHNWTAYKVAEEIYENRTFADLPILGDALEDAGCADKAILDHLRAPMLHVRGCWVLDLVLDKERLSREAAERNTLSPEERDTTAEAVLDQSA